MNQELYQQIILEVNKRSGTNLLDSSFEKQINFIRDPARMKAAFTTRRAGKSMAAGIYLLKEALAKPNISCLYIALTRMSAKTIMWRDILKHLVSKYKIKANFNETTLMITLSNGSTIHLTGGDAAPDEMEKLLGGKYKLIVIDEAASFRQDLKRLVYGVLMPTLVDMKGTLCLVGTPSNIHAGLYYDVTTQNEKGWSVHSWSAYDNPYIAEQWKSEIELLRLNNPLVVDTPLYQQMYEGKWAIDTSKLVYKFNEEKNVYSDLPHGEKFYHVLGVDLGYEDASAFVVGCYSLHNPNLFILEAYKRSKMIISQVADKIKEYSEKYNIHKIIIDDANKQAVEEMRVRYGLPLVAADKQGKSDFIELMNSDFIMQKVKIHESCDPLIKEYSALVWDDESERRQEHPGCDNHAADAALYMWRYCYNYAWEAKPIEYKRGTDEYMDKFWENEAEKVERSSKLPFYEREVYNV